MKFLNTFTWGRAGKSGPTNWGEIKGAIEKQKDLNIFLQQIDKNSIEIQSLLSISKNLNTLIENIENDLMTIRQDILLDKVDIQLVKEDIKTLETEDIKITAEIKKVNNKVDTLTRPTFANITGSPLDNEKMKTILDKQIDKTGKEIELYSIKNNQYYSLSLASNSLNTGVVNYSISKGSEVFTGNYLGTKKIYCLIGQYDNLSGGRRKVSLTRDVEDVVSIFGFIKNGSDNWSNGKTLPITYINPATDYITFDVELDGNIFLDLQWGSGTLISYTFFYTKRNGG